MIYVMLPSNNRMDIYPNNKISSFKVNFYGTKKREKTKVVSLVGVILLYNTEYKFMEEIKPGCYSSISGMVAEINAKIPAEPKT